MRLSIPKHARGARATSFPKASSRLSDFGFDRRRHFRAGFTLLEVLLALGIMSIVAVALFSSLHVAFKSKRVAEATLEPVRAGETVMELIRADLEGALPPRGVLAGAFTGRDWRGGGGANRDDDDVAFFTTAHSPVNAVPFGEIKHVQLTIVTLQSTGERALARRVTGNLLAPARVDPDDEILCRGVASFNLRYYDGRQWWNSWDSTAEKDSLPVAVEVTLELDLPMTSSMSPTSAGADRRADARDGRDGSGARLTRIVQIPCTGEGDPSDQPDEELDLSDGGGGAARADAVRADVLRQRSDVSGNDR